MVRNIKAKIQAELKSLCTTKKLEQTVITAMTFTDKLNIKRNTASHYLNELVKSGDAIKINTRPVCFFDKQVINQYLGKESENEYPSLTALFKQTKSYDAFDQVVGAKGSLFTQIKQMKAAARYPGVGLPILITGATGVGKSYLARIYYDYNVAQGYLSKKSRFVHLNCAEYADNPELLASILFGYRQGTFTGASQDSEGLFDQANQGMMFLDEVHRLGAKGQEKLFEYLDNGVITPLGETKRGHKVSVRLVFATTEEIGSTFLQTFIRRIPVQIGVPSLSERPPFERENLAKLFFLQQAKHIGYSLRFNRQVMTAITSHRYDSNVGELNNNVVLTVANALSRVQRDSPEKLISIYVSDLPDSIWQSTSIGQQIQLIGDKSPIIIDQTAPFSQIAVAEESEENQIRDTFQQLIKLYQKMDFNKTFLDSATMLVNTLCDELIYNKIIQHGAIPIKLFQQLFKVKLNIYENNDDVKFSGNTIIVLAYFFYYRQFNYWVLDQDKHEILMKLTNELANNYSKVTNFTDDLLNMIKDSLSFNGDIVDRIFLQLYMVSAIKVTHSNLIHGVVLAHGYSTASSIATVVNKMLNQPVLDYIDMPLDVDIKQIGQEITGYINRKTINTGLILMVDMGSLENVHRYIQTNVDFPIGVISNVSTQMALFVGEQILKQTEIQVLIKQAAKRVQTKSTFFYPEKTKKNLIITCCNTGIGTAKQIKQLLDASLPSRLNIVVNAYEYALLQSKTQVELLTKTFNVLAIVGTMDPQITGIPYIPLEKLILGEDLDQFVQALRPVTTRKEIVKFADTILHYFTIDRVINSLTILDAHTVMKNVDVAMDRYTGITNKPLNNRTRMALYVHVSCLIERLIRNEPITSYNWKQPNFDKQLFVNLKKTFSVMEVTYSVKIPDSEIGYIYDIVHGNQ